MKYINMEEFPKDIYTNSIHSKGIEYELSDVADFYSFEYDVNLRKVFLRWRFPGMWLLENLETYKKDYLKKYKIKKNKQRILTLVLHEVIYCEVKPRDKDMPFTEDDSLASIDFDHSIKSERLVFEFRSGTEISIEAAKIEFIDGN